MRALGIGLLVTALSTSAAADSLNVTASNNANTLINAILGGGVTVIGGSENYIGAATQSGTFTVTPDAGLGVGIDMTSGIVMTSGSALDAPGPNSSDNITTVTNTGTDADLNAEFGITTIDKSVLEFEFSLDDPTSTLFFNFAFASDEYNEFTNSGFNDVFAIFVDGVNIAFIEGTTTPVSINNVNGGNPLGTNATNPQFYTSNDMSDGVPGFNLEYDGFTDVFTAVIAGLGGGTHTIKFAIADVGDAGFDSGVFIQGGSLGNVDPDPIPEPSTVVLLGLAGLGFAAWRRRKRS
jgi:hypothetical protein